MSDGTVYLLAIVSVIVLWVSRRAWEAFSRPLDDPQPDREGK